jgi:hypothetical protein
MAFFGKKKEVQVEDIPLPDEMKPHLELRQEQESQFTSPEDLMKMTAEQMNPNFAQPEPTVQAMEPIKPAIQMPPVNLQQRVIAQPLQMTAQPAPQQEKSSFAPLFVKIDRYRNILKSVGEIKKTLALLKNAFKMFEQIDKIEDENMNLVRSAIDNVEIKIMALDAEFLRPSGFEDETAETEEFDNVQTVLSGLHSQIEQLKIDMQQV